REEVQPIGSTIRAYGPSVPWVKHDCGRMCDRTASDLLQYRRRCVGYSKSVNRQNVIGAAPKRGNQQILSVRSNRERSRIGRRKRQGLPGQRLQATIAAIYVKCFHCAARLMPKCGHAIGYINDGMEGMDSQSHGPLGPSRAEALPVADALSNQVQRSLVRVAKGAEAEQAIFRSNSGRSCESHIGQEKSRACPSQSLQKTPATVCG